MHPYARVFDNVRHLQRLGPGALRTRAQCGRRNFFTIIQQGREGWRLSYVLVHCILSRTSTCLIDRLGRDPVKLTPGLNLLIHQITTLDIRESSVDIPNVRSLLAAHLLV